jgi:exodeoxyribonuclease VII large subunit
MEQIAISFEPQRKTYTVSELSGRIRGLLAGEFTDIWVAGEISGCRTAASGHCYFTLKDEESQIQCVCFRGAMRYLRFKPQDGVAALVRGSIDVYEARGQYQLIAEAIEPQGHGALQLAFEQLKKKLAAEGLFEASRKRPLPKLPARIGIVTSPGGAVIQDLLNILLRRFPGLHIRLWPALVQGDGSVEQVCQGLEYFSRSEWAQVVIVARGGGSIEDLWTFNEEGVARAIANCSVPVISAIGHETDFTIADFVADLRAPTPSAAAELAVRTGQEILEQIAGAGHKLTQHVRYRLAMAARALQQRGVERASAALHRRIGRAQQRVDGVDYRMRDAMQRGLDARRRRLEEPAARLRGLDLRVRFGDFRRRLHMAEAAAIHAWQTRAALAGRRLETFSAHLTQLSPLRVLERGYAIVLNERGAVVKQAADAPPESTVEIRVARARLRARITESTEQP